MQGAIPGNSFNRKILAPNVGTLLSVGAGGGKDTYYV